MELGKFFHTKTGKYIMSLLLGFGLATLFRKTCKKQWKNLFFVVYICWKTDRFLNIAVKRNTKSIKTLFFVFKKIKKLKKLKKLKNLKNKKTKKNKK